MPRVDETQLEKELRARFGAALRTRRKELGISEDELSARSGIARSYLAEVQTVKQHMSLVTIGRIARALDIAISDFFARCRIDD